MWFRESRLGCTRIARVTSSEKLGTMSKNYLGAYARKFSNIDFFLKILPLKNDELVISEM